MPKQVTTSTTSILSPQDIAKKYKSGTVFLTVKQAAERFGVSPSFLYQRKGLPLIRLGGKGIRFIEAELLKFFKTQTMILK